MADDSNSRSFAEGARYIGAKHQVHHHAHVAPESATNDNKVDEDNNADASATGVSMLSTPSQRKAANGTV